MSRGPVIAFLGPSLPAAEARRVGRLELWPPARRGDVWRALSRRPRAIALIDGVFETIPSVWHHELCSALDAGIPVFGAASMGALRAAELEGEGMQGIGEVFAWVRSGVVRDDSEVALLHAGAEQAWRGFTVPLVTVRDRLRSASAAGRVSRSAAAAMLRVASQIHYADRSWAAIAARLSARLRRESWPAFERFLSSAGADVKARDARACLVAALAARGRPVPRSRPPSAAARRERLAAASVATADGGAVTGTAVLAALRAHRDSGDLTERGLDRALLAGWARQLGVTASDADVASTERRWLRACGVSRAGRDAFLACCGLDAGTARHLCEDVVLADLMRVSAAQLLPDGPSADDALLDEARLVGLVPHAVRRSR